MNNIFTHFYKGIFTVACIISIPFIIPPHISYATTYTSRHIHMELLATNPLTDAERNTLLSWLDSYYDAYQTLIGNAPYEGAPIHILERCNPAYNMTHTTITEQCPNGYSTGYWGYTEKQYITITENSFKEIASDLRNNSITFGLPHELSHSFDHWNNIPYTSSGTVAEAFANIKLLYALSLTHIPVSLNGVQYSNTKTLYETFYQPFFARFQEEGHTISSILDSASVVGDKADMYLALLMQAITETSSACFFDTLNRYSLDRLEDNSLHTSIRSRFFTQWARTCHTQIPLDFFRSMGDTQVPEAPQSTSTDIFLDMKDKPAFAASTFYLHEGLLNYPKEHFFYPERTLNRAEAAKLISTIVFHTDGTSNFTTFISQHPTYTYGYFTDVPLSAWYTPYIIALHELGVITGVHPTIFEPQRPIKRIEFLKMAMGSLHIDATEAWYLPYLRLAETLGLFRVYLYTSPEDTMSRAEAIHILYKIQFPTHRIEKYPMD